MKTGDPGFDSLPASAVNKAGLVICLKCAFDFFTKQLGLAPRTAYSELRKHVPEEADFSGAATARPHFFETEGVDHCPYCNAPKRWFARFYCYRVDAHPAFEKARKKLWTSLRRSPDRFTLFAPERTQMQMFSEWLERLKAKIDLDSEGWLMAVGFDELRRTRPVEDWDELLRGVRRIQVSHRIESGDFTSGDGVLYVSPLIYGDILLVQHLLSRSQHHGGQTFEGRLTLQELFARLRRMGYLELKGIDSHEAQQAFEEAVAMLVASGPSAVYYAVDRSDYLKQLKSIYEKQRAK